MGGVCCGSSGPTAIHTKLGWVLSGPTHSKEVDHCSMNLATTQCSGSIPSRMILNLKMIHCAHSGILNLLASVSRRKTCMMSLSILSAFRMVDTRYHCHGKSSMSPSQTITSLAITGFEDCCTDWNKLLSCESMTISYEINWLWVSLNLLWRLILLWTKFTTCRTMPLSMLIKLPQGCVLSTTLQRNQMGPLWMTVYTQAQSSSKDLGYLGVILFVQSSSDNGYRKGFFHDLCGGKRLRHTLIPLGWWSGQRPTGHLYLEIYQGVPFILNTTIKYHLELYYDSYIDLIECLVHSTYVYDIITGASSKDEALHPSKGDSAPMRIQSQEVPN